MLTREMIMNELTKRGYQVESSNVVKNGIELQGIVIGNGNIRPNIYVNDYLNWTDERLQEAVNNVVYTYENSNTSVIQFNEEDIRNWDYVKNNLQLCLQKKGHEYIVKRDFLDLEQYVRVVVSIENDEKGSFKVFPNHLEMWNITEDILFNAAWDCTRPTLTERDMVHIVAEMMHVDVEEVLLHMGDMPTQIILGNKEGAHGAIAMCDTWTLSKIANNYESNLVILPSSIHEVIVIPDESMSLIAYDRMVQEVNREQLAPEEVLSNHAYKFDRATMEITW